MYTPDHTGCVVVVVRKHQTLEEVFHIELDKDNTANVEQNLNKLA